MTNLTHLVETYPKYISTKFEENLDSGFGEEDKNVIVAGRRPITKTQLYWQVSGAKKNEELELMFKCPQRSGQ